jgi:hypothetical protein
VEIEKSKSRLEEERCTDVRVGSLRGCASRLPRIYPVSERSWRTPSVIVGARQRRAAIDSGAAV